MKNEAPMRRPPSLALRVTLLFGMVSAVVFSGFGWITERSIEHHFDSGDISELDNIARAVHQTLFTNTAPDNPAARERRFNDILVGHRHAVLYITRENGQRIFVSRNAPDIPSLQASDNNADSPLYRWKDENHSYRILSRRMSQEIENSARAYIVTIAVAVDYHQRFLDGFRRTLWIMIAAGIVISSLLGWVSVRRGHAPLHRIVAQIHQISANQLQTRLQPETVPRELSDLALSFNEMLERIEESFQRLSNFSADIAHELRTPVTTLMTQTQVALSQARTLDEYREILYSNIEEYERMAQMISDMLFLARSDNDRQALATTTMELADEIRALFDYYEAWAEEQDVTLALEGRARVDGDRLMLRRALSNLISNAIRHTPATQTVDVRLARSATDAITITVENPGPTIPPEHIPRLFDRFYRVDASRQRGGDGAGLGLAITKSIIEIHGGNIELSSSQGRTQFRITLPG